MEFDSLQVGSGIRFRQRHGTCVLPSAESGKKFLALFFGSEFPDRVADVLQSEQVHQRSIGPGDQFHGHHVNREGEVEAPVLSRENHAHQVSLRKLPQVLLCPGRVGDLPVLQGHTFVVHARRARRNVFGTQSADHFQHFFIIEQCVRIVHRCIGKLLRLFVVVFGNGRDRLQVEFAKVEQDILVVEKEIWHGSPI